MIRIPANNSIKIIEKQLGMGVVHRLKEQFNLEGKSIILVNYSNRTFFKLFKKDPNSIIIVDEPHIFNETDLNKWLADATNMEIYIVQMKNNEYYTSPEIIKV